MTPTFDPRKYQDPVLAYLMNGGWRRKRAVLCWHRQAGKDMVLWNAVHTTAMFDRAGLYFYVFPTYALAKKVIWDGMDYNGNPFTSFIPADAILDKNETELQLIVKNVSGGHSIIQLVGSDRVDNLRGTRPLGAVFSEYSYQKPSAWDTIEPVLTANKGWAAFAYTPKGHNHGWRLYEHAGREIGWFRQLLTIEDTADENGDPIVTKADLDEKRRRGIDEDFLQQEYYCSFFGSMQGSYYGKAMALAHEQKRITDVPYEPQYPVETWWDIGRNDENAIWFAQHVGRQVRLIDYYENTGEGLPHYAKVLLAKDYAYARHIFPHDINVTEYSTNAKRIDTARSLGLKPVKVAPKLSPEEGREAVRRMLPRCVFDQTKCKRGITALEEYHKKWDEDTQSFSDTHVHDWASNAADAFRYGAILDSSGREPMTQLRADTDYNVLGGDERQQMADSEYNVLA